MSHLFIKDTFDTFLCKEIVIDTFVSYRIDGSLLYDFLSDAEQEELASTEFAPWSMLKPLCFQLIKGSRTPLGLRAVFALSQTAVLAFVKQEGLAVSPEEISGLYLNIRYENRQLHIVTGASRKTFSLDKSVEQAWDEAAVRFFKKTLIN